MLLLPHAGLVQKFMFFVGRGLGGHLFEGGRFLSCWAFRVGAYSKVGS